MQTLANEKENPMFQRGYLAGLYDHKLELKMTEDNMATRLPGARIGAPVTDVYGCPFGEISDINYFTDEVVIKTNRGISLTVSGSTLLYAGGGLYSLLDVIDLDDVVEMPAAEPDKTNTNIDDLLAERETRYGAYNDHAIISQSLKHAMVNSDGWKKLSSCQKETLEMIAHKIARVLNGDPNYADNWVDIAGYAQLVVNELENN